MRKVLIIVTTENEPLNEAAIAAQRHLPDQNVKIVALTQPDADYRALLEEIFTADSVQVW
ncbi:MAG: hypothetical protein HY043_16375 [Verrucomicrobia bacterium]|nr:hypothetical protein [Verrucomicrobiota bacterium]